MAKAGDTVIDSSPVIEKLHEEIERLGTQRAAADKFGVSASYITDLLKGLREPGKKLLKAIGFVRIVRYERLE